MSRSQLVVAGYSNYARDLSMKTVMSAAIVFALGAGILLATGADQTPNSPRRDGLASWAEHSHKFHPPIGAILAYAGSWPTTGPARQATEDESGWLLCDGRSVRKSEFPELYQRLKGTFGESKETFNLPSLAGRTIVGAGKGTQLTARKPGQAGGSETHRLTVAEMPSHSHGVSDPGHAHGFGYISATANWGDNANDRTQAKVHNRRGSTDRATTGIRVQPAGGNQPHNVMQPFLVTNYIIRAR